MLIISVVVDIAILVVFIFLGIFFAFSVAIRWNKLIYIVLVGFEFSSKTSVLSNPVFISFATLIRFFAAYFTISGNIFHINILPRKKIAARIRETFFSVYNNFENLGH